MAPSPCSEALARGRRNGAPVNVVFVSICGEIRTRVLNSLAGRHIRSHSAVRSSTEVKEILVGKASNTRIFFTDVSNATSPPSDFDPIRRHLLSRRPANVFVYIRSADVSTVEEASFFQELESSLGKQLWQNAICVNVVQPENGVPVEEPIPQALLRPGLQPTSCFWDGSSASSANLASFIADVAAITNPFIPQLLTKKNPQTEAKNKFADLDLVSSNILSAFESTAEMHPPQGRCSVEPVSVHIPGEQGRIPGDVTSDCGAIDSPSFGIHQHQPQLVPAFASLSMAFAPPMAFKGPSLIQSRPAISLRNPKPNAQKRAPAALRGLSAVCAPAVGGEGCVKGSMAMSPVGLPSQLEHSSVLGVGAWPKSETAFPDVIRLPKAATSVRGPKGLGSQAGAVIVWFRSDLRVHDNEVLAAANQDGASVIPFFCFDPKHSAGSDGPCATSMRFLVESVADLRRTLRTRGSDLVVRVGDPAAELAAVARAVGASSVYAHGGVGERETQEEQRVVSALQDAGVESAFFWGSTLFHPGDLPFPLHSVPRDYQAFQDCISTVQVRPAAEVSRRLKQLPAEDDISTGEIPSLGQLGVLQQPSSGSKNRQPSTCGHVSCAILRQSHSEPKEAEPVGGESEALKHLSAFLSEAVQSPGAQVQAPTTGSSISPHMLGVRFFCRVSNWLALGCVSPKRILEEIKGAAPGVLGAGVREGEESRGTPGSLDWIAFELLWRDFYRFITTKQTTGNPDGAPVACAT